MVEEELGRISVVSWLVSLSGLCSSPIANWMLVRGGIGRFGPWHFHTITLLTGFLSTSSGVSANNGHRKHTKCRLSAFIGGRKSALWLCVSRKEQSILCIFMANMLFLLINWAIVRGIERENGVLSVSNVISSCSESSCSMKQCFPEWQGSEQRSKGHAFPQDLTIPAFLCQHSIEMRDWLQKH